jgi:hypothetical protein
MQRGFPPFPVFSDSARPWHAVYRELMWDGFVTFLEMVYYHAPEAVLLSAGFLLPVSVPGNVPARRDELGAMSRLPSGWPSK